MKWWVKLGYLIAFSLIASGMYFEICWLIGAGAIITPILGIILD